MSRLMMIVLLLAGGLLAASPAAALESGCLWRNLPEAKRSALVADYATRGAAVLRDIEVLPSDVAVWMPRCGMTEATAEHAGMLLGTEILEHGVSAKLQAAYGLSSAALAAAWAGVEPGVRAQARASVKNTLDGGPRDDGGQAAIEALMRGAGLPEPAARDAALYIFALLAREVLVTQSGTGS